MAIDQAGNTGNIDAALGVTTKSMDLLTRAGKAKDLSELSQVRAETGQEMLGAIEEESKAALTKLQEEPKIKAEFAKKEAELFQKADIARKEALEGAPLPDFKPVKETIMSMATLSSMIALTGQALGNTGGRQSGLNAINSMTGLMSGYQQGRKDIQRQNQIEFEKNLQIMTAKQNQIQKEFEMAIKKMPYDLAGARADMEVSLAKVQSPVLQAAYRKQGPMATFNIIKDIGADLRYEMKLAQDLALAKDKALKPSDRVQMYFQDSVTFRNDMNRLEKKLENPTLRQQIDKYKVQSYLFEDGGKIANLLVSERLPSELREYLVDIVNIRNKRYKDMSGAAVTGNEALRNYGANLQPGQSADVALTQIKVGRSQAERTISQLQTSYPVFKNMITEPIPQINQETQQPQKDDKGRVLMIDANNRKAYVNPNNPNDYVEVED